MKQNRPTITAVLVSLGIIAVAVAWNQRDVAAAPQRKDAKHVQTGQKESARDPELAKYGIYAKSAPRAETTTARTTTLPLELRPKNRIALVGNTLLERDQHFGYIESMLQRQFPEHELVVRNLCWPADTPDIQPRPTNYADLVQHLTHEKADVIIAAFGFSESFAGQSGVEPFRQSLSKFVTDISTKAFNGKTGPQVVLLSPIANEDVPGVPATQNNANVQLYADTIRAVAAQQNVAFVDLYTPTLQAMASSPENLTINGVHLNASGYDTLAETLCRSLFEKEPHAVDERLRRLVVDKSEQFLRRYRPLNTFYYTGDRNKSYGYLDFLPAMRNFDIMVANRDRLIWERVQGKPIPSKVDDSNVPPLPRTKESRGANRWISAEDERKEFEVDSRFNVNLFAGEEEFPDIAAPIQIRWDNRGRLWVACSTTYPHVYPGNEPNDKLVILEDTDGDGRADKSSLFADNLHIPLSFEFGDGGVYVSDEPHLTFIKDTDGDGRADFRRRVLTGFGTEDSHHSLHDFTWTPDGDLIFREGIFHHSQVETAYGPVRQRNSGWFRFTPRTQRLVSFGTYHSTNPWGVTFDDWGQHVASHPIYAAAFHAIDPPYPIQHPRPTGLRAYSGTCGQEFVDFKTFPAELQGHYIKARYKPTNRIEIHKWREEEFGFDEEYVGDLIFSKNLSFIPVDIRFGPRGALYICDWYNPIKGHAQYSLRDERRDRHSGRIWRVTGKGKPLQDAINIAEATIPELLDLLKRSQYRYRYWAKRELRERDTEAVHAALNHWVSKLSPDDKRLRHHQLEAVWTYRWIGRSNAALLRELLACENHLARAAAVQQLRYWHTEMPDAIGHIRAAANHQNSTVRMQAAIAASYIGTKPALDAMLDVTRHPSDGHLSYAIASSLGSKTLRRHWEGDAKYNHVAMLLKRKEQQVGIKEPRPNKTQSKFDKQDNLKTVHISCLSERMLYSVREFSAKPGQPVKIVFTNPDATDHNLLVVRDGDLEEVGLAANEMARDPANANSDFIPSQKRHLIIQSSPMIGPTRKSRAHVLRFLAPNEPGVYPYVCTFPGHWVVMNGMMIVADSPEHAEQILAAREPLFVNEWKLTDFPVRIDTSTDDKSIMRGMAAFVRARCNQCHQVAGQGVNLGPDLTEVNKKYRGRELLRQILEPSTEINKEFQTVQFAMDSGKVISGVVRTETPTELKVVSNLLTPDKLTTIRKSEIEFRSSSTISMMPSGMLDSLNREEIIDLLSFLESKGGIKLPPNLEGVCKPANK
ncbi:PVC-type heme-binding CxxCH protein [Planctomycetota bacterium]